MPHGKNIAGRTFGGLTAVAPTPRRTHGSVVWQLRCGCGTSVERAMRYLSASEEKGWAPSCGCLTRGRASAFAIDLTGARYGRLKVISCEDAKGQGLRWRCECDCGNFTIARTKDLRAETTTSCGCGRGAGARRRQPAEWRGGTIENGEKFGRLTVGFLVCLENGARHYWCDCACGGGKVVRGGLLVSGQTKSCGCLRGRPAAAKKAEARQRAIQTAGKTASSLKADAKTRLELNAEMGRGRFTSSESA
jgi:hypothetical protein